MSEKTGWNWKCWIAAGLGAGLIKTAPGTWGSLAGIIPVYLVSVTYSSPLMLLFLAIFMLLLGVYCIPDAQKYYEKSDPRQVVIDEIAAMPLVFLFVPLSPIILLVGFGLFRLLDIVKPPPIGTLEKLPGAWGVMMDDTLAGLISGGFLWMLLKAL